MRWIVRRGKKGGYTTSLLVDRHKEEKQLRVPKGGRIPISPANLILSLATAVLITVQGASKSSPPATSSSVTPTASMRRSSGALGCWIVAPSAAQPPVVATRRSGFLPAVVTALPFRAAKAGVSHRIGAARQNWILSRLRGGRGCQDSAGWQFGRRVKRLWSSIWGNTEESGFLVDQMRSSPPMSSRRAVATKATGKHPESDLGWGRELLDRASFGIDVHCWALRVAATQSCDAMDALRRHILREHRIKPVVKDVEDPSGNYRLLLVRGSSDDFSAPSPAPELVKVYASNHDVDLRPHIVHVGYDSLNAAIVLRALLPPELEVPSAFEMVGHIAHLNIKEEHLAFKGLIGQVVLDKNPAIRTVVNKVGSIENEFRVFDMEILAGEEDLIASVKQGGATFRLDYSKVYWNSRLSTEHATVCDSLPANAVVWDVFAGIGPFAVPSAMKGCTVYANDLNPDSHKWCKENCKLNLRRRSGAGKVSLFNLDAREFIRRMVREAEERSGDARPIEVIMNLPAMAPEFLDAFRGAFDPARWLTREMPMIHLYAFSREEDVLEDIAGRVDRALGVKIERGRAKLREVRLVAPRKMMLCCEFMLPRSILVANASA